MQNDVKVDFETGIMTWYVTNHGQYQISWYTYGQIDGSVSTGVHYRTVKGDPGSPLKNQNETGCVPDRGRTDYVWKESKEEVGPYAMNQKKLNYYLESYGVVHPRF